MSSILFNYQKIVEIVKIDFLQKIKKSSNSILNEKKRKKIMNRKKVKQKNSWKSLKIAYKTKNPEKSDTKNSHKK